MSSEDQITQSASGDHANLDEMTIAQARKYAALYRVPIEKDMTRQEIIDAIKAKMKDKDMAVIAVDGSRPLPGWARIELNRDPAPGAGNRPVYLSINGYRITIPRGVACDVPIKVLGVLNDSRELRIVENPQEPMNSPRRYTRQYVLSYPFQVMDVNPGVDPRPGYELSKESHYGPRKQFCDLFGRWPKPHELLEAQKEGFIKLTPLSAEKAYKGE